MTDVADDGNGPDDTTLSDHAGAYRDPAPFACEAQGQSLAFYPAGKDRLDALLDLIAGARRTLRLCFYIFAEDDVSHRVRDALTAAARRGVAVQLLLDGFGADASDEFLAPLTGAGGWHGRFGTKWSQRYLIRNHQKMAIADDDIAMIGGFNISDDYFAPPAMNGWNDMGVTVRGSAVASLIDWYDRLITLVADSGTRWRDVRRAVRQWNPGDGAVQLLIGGPTRGMSSWAHRVGQDLRSGDRLDMMMAYFSPSRRLMKRIGGIAAKGDTRLVMAGKSDNDATIGATRSLYHDLLQRGARVWEFLPCKMHTKLIVLDDAVYFGSANFDMRSLYLNLEIMLRIEDAALADRMREFVGAHLAASQEIDRGWLRARDGLWTRIRWNLSWFLVAVADYTVSRRLNIGP
ncbi:phosphatidylserine/phosphatidylglycerophosphate/cardiolipin synthase family protein [uncultured Croceicoccus sp.]|uniref:phospholipase D-like domain-containing protein n=1 Tax=uncultured Croceicoccus sp. TaxID=1295329 RepID=UPI00261ED35A|nr:phosphatidylserine/phosphatidylglycerophosphate/cardiolipin synthase family protein [uncultured Croceicoccus sp.]